MDELFKQSARHLPVFDQDNQVLTIDNFYDNPEEIYEWLITQQYPLWNDNRQQLYRRANLIQSSSDLHRMLLGRHQDMG